MHNKIYPVIVEKKNAVLYKILESRKTPIKISNKKKMVRINYKEISP